MIKFFLGTIGLSLLFAFPLSKAINQHKNNLSKTEEKELRRFDSVIVLESKSETSANISFGDIDSDGDLDIVLAKGRHWPLFNKILFNNGKTEFTNVVDLGTKPDNTYSTVLADLDGDSDFDIVVSNDKDDKLVYLNNGKGIFSISQTWGDAKWNTRNATVANLNNDGKLDIIAANRKQPSYYSLNDGFGKFSPQNTKAIPSESATTIVPADFNNDGFIDLAIPHRDGGQSLIFYNDGKVNFSQTKAFGPAISNARTAAAADLNKDGWIDLVVGDEQSGTFIYLNDKKGGLIEPISLGEKIAASAIVIGDLNNDMMPDIVVGYAVSKTTAFFNVGNASKFTTIKFGDGKGTVYGMALGDINKDGFLDIGVACSDASNVVYISQKTIK
jgi:hypothetical protein